MRGSRGRARGALSRVVILLKAFAELGLDPLDPSLPPCESRCARDGGDIDP